MPTGSRSLQLYSIYAMLLTDIAGYSLLIPLVPFITESLKGTSVEIGILFGLYAALQFVGSYILGYFSDRYGRHIFIIISVLGQFIGCIGQSFSKDLWIFIGFRLFTGLFDCTLVIVQACITDLTTIDERARYIAQIDAVYSCGFILGPILGAFLSKISLKMALYTSTGLFGLSLILAIFLVRETLPKTLEIKSLRNNIKQLTKDGKLQEAELEKITLQNKFSEKIQKASKTKFHFSFLIIIVLIEEFANKWLVAALDAVYGEFAEEKYEMDTFIFSLLNAGEGILNAIQQGLLYDFFIGKLNIPIATVTLIAGICDIIGILIAAYSPNLILSGCGVLLVFFGFGFCTPCAPTVVSTETSAEAQGQALSIVFFGGQLSQVIAPLLLGWLYSIQRELSISISALAGIIITIFMSILLCLPGGKAAGKIPHEEYLKSLKEGNDLLVSKKECEKKELINDGFNEYDIEYNYNNNVSSYVLDGEIHYITNNDHSVSMGTGLRNISSRQLLTSEYDDIEEYENEPNVSFEPTLIQYNNQTKQMNNNDTQTNDSLITNISNPSVKNNKVKTNILNEFIHKNNKEYKTTIKQPLLESEECEMNTSILPNTINNKDPKSNNYTTKTN